MAADLDREYMELALSLAERGRGSTSPNPLVGAIVVRDGTVVGSGWHERAGSDHAEITALREAGSKAIGATLYVTMEPCCHFGKTPPCTDAVIRSGVSRVVAAMTDPNPRVCGGGFFRLAERGIKVETGLCEEAAQRQNEAYVKHIRTGIPFLTLKIAATLDGRIAARDGTSRWITESAARVRVHRMRAWNDAVMVGSGTVIADDPLLTVRDAAGKDPLRVVLDSRLRTSPDARVYTPGTIVAAGDDSDPGRAAEFERRGVEVWRAGTSDGHVDIGGVLKHLGERGIVSVLCEGGSGIATAVLRHHLADKICFFIGPKILGDGLQAIGDIGAGTMGSALDLEHVEIEALENDVLVSGYPRYR